MIDGHRRLLAARHAGLDTLPAVIIKTGETSSLTERPTDLNTPLIGINPKIGAPHDCSDRQRAQLGRQGELEWLSLDVVIPSDMNPRKDFSDQALSTLRDSIGLYGQLQPSIVQRYKPNANTVLYKLIEGERRYHTAKKIGMKEIPCLVVDRPLSDHDELELMFQIHGERKGWTQIEEAWAIKRLEETNGKLSNSEIARRLHMNPTVVSERRILADASPKVQKEVASGELDAKVVTHARQVENLVAKHPPDLYAELGGKDSVYERALAKGRSRKGVAEELKRLKTDLAEPDVLSNDDLTAYLGESSLTLRDVEKGAISVSVNHATRRLRATLSKATTDAETILHDLAQVTEPNLLRSDLTKAITLLTRIVTALVEADVERRIG